MDRVIEKKTWNKKRIMIIGGIAALVALITFAVISTSGKSKLDVDPDRITISEVTKGPFQENIPVNGVVLPLTTIVLDAVEGGRVEQLFVEDGTDMKAGQPIMKLSDIELELSVANQQTAVFNVFTQMQLAKDQARQSTIGLLQNMEDAENAFREAQRVYKLDKGLYAQKAIGQQEYQVAENTYDYALHKRNLNAQILKQDSATVKLQAQQAQETYTNMQSTLELMKKEVGSLIVTAPVDGQLTSMDAQVGENINKGEKLGEIDVMSGYKVRVNIDDHYISRIYNGLTGTFQFADKNYNLKIKKVFAQVTAGQFQCDMVFVGPAPTEIRNGLTLQVTLNLSSEVQAVLVPKGGFYQAGGNYIFKVSADGKTATRVPIQLNRMSNDYYEVLSGIQPGDKVITSGYDTYGDIQELVLTK